MPVPYQCFESGETKTSPFGSSPQKLKCWIYIPFFSFPPKGEAVSWAFSLDCTELYWLRGRATEMKCSGFSYIFHCACSWVYAHLGCSPGSCGFLAGFWSCHKVFWDHILLSICLWGGTRSGISYSIILMMSLYMFYNKIAKCGYQRATCSAAVDESICPHPPSWSFSAQALSWQNSI